MPCRYGVTAEHRIMTELVEADFEIGFSLVDLATASPTHVQRPLADAELVFVDILARLANLPSDERENFVPLLTELRRAIDLASVPPE